MDDLGVPLFQETSKWLINGILFQDLRYQKAQSLIFSSHWMENLVQMCYSFHILKDRTLESFLVFCHTRWCPSSLTLVNIKVRHLTRLGWWMGVISIVYSIHGDYELTNITWVGIDVPTIGDFEHHQNKYMLDIISPIVGWCETLGHRNQPLYFDGKWPIIPARDSTYFFTWTTTDWPLDNYKMGSPR